MIIAAVAVAVTVTVVVSSMFVVNCYCRLNNFH